MLSINYLCCENMILIISKNYICLIIQHLRVQKTRTSNGIRVYDHNLQAFDGTNIDKYETQTTHVIVTLCTKQCHGKKSILILSWNKIYTKLVEKQATVTSFIVTILSNFLLNTARLRTYLKHYDNLQLAGYNKITNDDVIAFLVHAKPYE